MMPTTSEDKKDDEFNFVVGLLSPSTEDPEDNVACGEEGDDDVKNVREMKFISFRV